MIRHLGRFGARFSVITIVALAIVACASTLSRDELAIEYYNIGSAYFDLEQLDKSATYLTRAIDLSPGLARASYNLARVYVLQGRHESAIDLLDDLLAEDPGNTLVMSTIAYTYYLEGDPEQAARWYDRALSLSPTDLDLLQNRATVAMDEGDYAVAATLLRRAVDLTDERPVAFLTLARAERALGNDEAAIAAYRQYLGRTPTPSPGALFGLAEVLEAQEYYADALDSLERITADEGVDPAVRSRAHFRRGRLFLTMARDEEFGMDSVRAALDLGFDNADDAAALLASAPPAVVDELRALFVSVGLLGPEGVPDVPQPSPNDTAP